MAGGIGSTSDSEGAVGEAVGGSGKARGENKDTSDHCKEGGEEIKGKKEGKLMLDSQVSKRRD